jgi:hypothetical protein
MDLEAVRLILLLKTSRYLRLSDLRIRALIRLLMMRLLRVVRSMGYLVVRQEIEQMKK